MSFREKNGGERKNSLAVLFVCLQKLTFRELRGKALSPHLFIFSLFVILVEREKRELPAKERGWSPKRYSLPGVVKCHS